MALVASGMWSAIFREAHVSGGEGGAMLLLVVMVDDAVDADIRMEDGESAETTWVGDWEENGEEEKTEVEAASSK